MRILPVSFGLAFALLAMPQTASALVNVDVDLSSQTMRVSSGSGESYVWPISSARRGYVTPRGVYRAQSLARMHYSRKYDNAPMPHSIFFRGGYAIHATYSVGALGRPASHGCIRLSPAHAAQLYGMVQREGARIRISGSPNYGATAFASRRTSTRVASSRGAQPLGYAPRSDSALDFWLRDPAGPFRR
jgi:hypothetical protein